MKIFVSRATKAYVIRVSALFFASLALVIAGACVLVQIDAEERDEWVTATCTVQKSLPSSLTKSPCAVWLVAIVAPFPTRLVEAVATTTNDTVCGVIVPRQAAVSTCIDEPTEHGQSGDEREGPGELNGLSPKRQRFLEKNTFTQKVWPCRVPASPKRWIFHSSGLCSSTAELVRPRRLTYVAPSAGAAEIAVGEALNQHRSTAIFLTITGAFGLLGAILAVIYACYWQALHTCAEVMLAKRRGRKRREQARQYRARAGEYESDTDDEDEASDGDASSWDSDPGSKQERGHALRKTRNAEDVPRVFGSPRARKRQARTNT